MGLTACKISKYDKEKNKMSKKLWYSLTAVLVISAIVLTACGPATTQAPPATQAPATQAPATQAPATEAPTQAATEAATEAASGKVEVFSCWFRPGEAAG